MARYKIYQVQRLDICSTKECYTYEVKLNVIAEYEITKPYKDSVMLAEDIWDACNVSCWKRDWEDGEVVVKEHTTTYPDKKLFPGYVNSDFIVETPDGLYRAETVGFKKVETLDEGMYSIIYTNGFINWKDIRNKQDFNEEEFDKVIKMINEEK